MLNFNSIPQIQERYLFIIVALLATVGLLTTFSASYYISFKLYGSHYSIFLRQCVYMLSGIIAFMIVYKIPIEFWFKHSLILLLASYCALILVLFIGKEINGSRRWLNLGIINLQVSEFSKLFLFMHLARFLSKNRNVFEDLQKLLAMFGFIGFYSILIFIEPDFSGMMLVLFTIFIVLFLNGMPLSILAKISGLGTALIGIAIFAKPHIIKRFLGFLNPMDDPLGSGYQAVQSWIAIKNGGLFGAGLGNSTQKLGILPESHNDFIFAILIEELGILFALGVVISFLGLLLYLLITTTHKGGFAHYLSSFLIVSLIFNILINISVALGLIPITGISLPLFSYGGSLILYFFIVMAIIFKARQI